jgi:UDP-N-acetylglucosamine 4-epimerase
MKKNILVTGGAGFIGSNLVEALLDHPLIGRVSVLDNLSTGFYKNIEKFTDRPDFDFLAGDIRDFDTCRQACEGMDLISHQAALGSVPRSIQDPVTSNDVNIGGTVNIFTAAKEAGIKRVIYAASSSTYGDSKQLPKIEHQIGKPLSPYAITKYVMELYAGVFADLYDMEFIGLRYFNVFGPKQDPHGAYAAVIPLFFKAALNKEAAVINGDGSFSRDFTYVGNAVKANILALFTENKNALNQVYNIACGEQTSLDQLWSAICKVLKIDIKPIHGPERKGDIPHSLADITKGNKLLNYIPETSVSAGLEKAADWYRELFT